MKKPLLLTALSLSAINCIPFAVNNHTNFATNDSNTNVKDNQMIDFKALNKDIATYALQQLYPNQTITSVSNVDVKDLNMTNVDGKIVGSSSSSNPTALFMGEVTLDNSQGIIERTLKTDSYQKQVTNEISHTVTSGISIGAKAKIDIFNLNLEYDYNNSKTETKSETITVTSPSQSIIVPAHTKYLVKTFLGQNTTKVDIDLNATIAGTITGNYTLSGSNDILEFGLPLALSYQQYSSAHALPDGISIDLVNQVVNFHGLANAENVSESDIYSVNIEEVPS